MPQLYAHTADHTAYTALYGVYVYDDMIFWVIIWFLKTLTTTLFMQKMLKGHCTFRL
jgi:hypothetical protein